MKYLLMFFAGIMLFACKTEKTYTTEEISTFTSEFNTWLDEAFDEQVLQSPMTQTYLGVKQDYDKLDDMTEAFYDAQLEQSKDLLSALKKWENGQLDEQAQITRKLMISDLERNISNDKFRHFNYPAHQMWGVHDRIPSFMINMHKVTEKSDAEAYVARLKDTKRFLQEGIAQMKLREEKGVMPPQFVYPHIIGAAENVIQGAPFDDGEDSPLLADFKRKVNDLDIASAEKIALIDECKVALGIDFQEGYDELIAFLKDQATRATTDDGVWKLDNGDAYYKSRLKAMTTTDMTADEIHETGLKEIERIHGEMRDIMKQVGFEGDLQEFFEFMRTDKQFYYSSDQKGKDAYLTKTNEIIDGMRDQLDGLFITKPKAELVVKAVEPFREKAAGKAFYQGPAPDGSRPGTYYANLYDMTQMPTYQMEALAYHEALPGHHMQIAIKQELEGLPKFRTQGGGYTAYSEGWGLYSELVPKELGFYSDPYSDFGRLAMELWRCCRLVVDTGIHAKKWTREEGIAFYKENTPNPEDDCVKMVERHIVMPGQATAYKIGQLKILELRAKAKDALGEAFDIREFHDVVLTSGAVPLDV
ncbi:MAG: DUF885 domain-containing protein, partial [Saprospiraceae bacterium]|nr:DUF885 domain-containing protein [Saprospiraceae bacterium]